MKSNFLSVSSSGITNSISAHLEVYHCEKL